MAYGLIYKFPSSVGRKEYEAVNAKLEITADDPSSPWPDGLLTHASGTTNTGEFWLYETWESKTKQEAFMNSRLGAALADVGVPAPEQLIELDLINQIIPA
jgi:hypothetical protein